MEAQLSLGTISVDVVFKDIKNVHLSVHPPNGRVRISAPRRMKLDSIRLFAISKLDWIKREQTKLQAQDREGPRECIDRESHFLWGHRYLLEVVETDSASHVRLTPRKLLLSVRPQFSEDRKRELLAQFYRDQIKQTAPSLIKRWAPHIGIDVDRFYVRRMKTKWGSCNPRSRTIRLNTELAKKPIQCLEYIVLHEMVHLIEPHHGDRFVGLMNTLMPSWQFHRDELNSHPLCHEKWY